MWILFAVAAAFFAGVTSILAKIGIKNTDSFVATAIRTVVVFTFAWVIVLFVGSFHEIFSLSTKTFFYLILSGLATGASWICFFHALQLGEVNKVTPIDKSSTILTIIFAFVFLKEEVTFFKIICVILIAVGTYLMIQKQKVSSKETRNSWLIYALLAAFFASITSILAKIGIESVESNLGTAIRTTVVLLMAWFIVFYQKKQATIRTIDKTSWIYLILSGLTTGASWLFFFYALQKGPASIVVPIDKLSIVVTVIFSYFVFNEKLSEKSFIGLILIVIGTLLLLI